MKRKRELKLRKYTMKNLRLIVVLFGILGLASPSVSFADEKKIEEKKEPVKLEQIVVEAPRTEEELKVDVPVLESTYQVGVT
ncbi:hypothetical protein KA005_68600, partial [bacterium]|nr:hypothetical protein [bacterium]